MKEGVASASQVFAIIMEAAFRKRWKSNPTGPSPLVTIYVTSALTALCPCLSQHGSPRPVTLLGVIASQTTPADSLVAHRFWETLLASLLEDLGAIKHNGTRISSRRKGWPPLSFVKAHPGSHIGLVLQLRSGHCVCPSGYCQVNGLCFHEHGSLRARVVPVRKEQPQQLEGSEA